MNTLTLSSAVDDEKSGNALLAYDPLRNLVTLFPRGQRSPIEFRAAHFILEFEHRKLEPCTSFGMINQEGDKLVCEGKFEGSGLRFEVTWTASAISDWARKKISISGKPSPEWGRFLRLYVISESGSDCFFDDQLGWRERSLDWEPIDRENRNLGFLPPCGYPVFSERFFAGLEHPMGVARYCEGKLELYHHPRWEETRMVSFSAIVGIPQDGEDVEKAFGRYIGSIRRPAPERAIVEINTFWTDRYETLGRRPLKIQNRPPQLRPLDSRVEQDGLKG